MKNKKMVATLASLCLIVVAVVAAVVGVLAAVNQSVHSTFKVQYTAKNVYATVTLTSKGPTETNTPGVRQLSASWDAAAESAGTDTFMPQEGVRTATLEGTDYNFGWASESSGSTFYGVAIYRFEIQNLGGNSITLSKELSSEPTNLTYKFYISKNISGNGSNASGLAFANITPDYGTNGALSSLTVATNIDGETGDEIEEWTTGTKTVPATTTKYVYWVVAVASTVANIDANTDIGSLLSFSLAGDALA